MFGYTCYTYCVLLVWILLKIPMCPIRVYLVYQPIVRRLSAIALEICLLTFIIDRSYGHQS